MVLLQDKVIIPGTLYPLNSIGEWGGGVGECYTKNKLTNNKLVI